MTAPGTTDPLELQIGRVRYETGEGKVRIALGAFVKDVAPSTARMIAIALIHNAELAGLPPLPPDDEILGALSLSA